MSPDENKTIMQRFIKEVFNEKRLDRTDALVAPDYTDHGALSGQAPGIVGAKQRWAMFNRAVPDLRTTIEDMVAEGDKVVVRYTVEGTHQGELMGLPPTGKRFRFSGINLTRLVEGKLAEHWEQMDTLGLMQQLGAIPPPDQSR